MYSQQRRPVGFGSKLLQIRRSSSTPAEKGQVRTRSAHDDSCLGHQPLPQFLLVLTELWWEKGSPLAVYSQTVRHQPFLDWALT